MSGGNRLRDAIEQVHEDLDRVRKVRKCVACECLLDVLEAVQTDLEGIDSPEAVGAKKDFGQWLDIGNAKRHRCLGCEVCLPTEPYNRFSTFLREAGVEQVASPMCEVTEVSACGCGAT